MTTTPANPLDNQAAITQLHQAMSFLVTDLIRPNAEQIAATHTLCENNARSIAAEAVKTRELRESLEIVRQVADDTADDTNDHSPRISENESRFDILLAEAREDRHKSDERFEAMGQRLEEHLSEIRAQGELIRALLSALATTNGRVDNLEQAS